MFIFEFFGSIFDAVILGVDRFIIFILNMYDNGFRLKVDSAVIIGVSTLQVD